MKIRELMQTRDMISHEKIVTYSLTQKHQIRTMRRICVIMGLIMSMAVSAQDMRSTLLEIIQDRDLNEVLHEQEAHYLENILTDNCDSLLISKTLLAYMAAYNHWTPQTRNWIKNQWPDACDVQGPEWAFFSGNALYNINEFEKAIEHFAQAEKLHKEIGTKAKCIENIAVCYVAMDEISEATRYFEIALSLTTDEPNPMTINNLAGIYNSTNEPLRALQTLSLLEEVALEEPVRRHVAINRLAANKALQDTARLQELLGAFVETYPEPIYPQEAAEVMQSMMVLDEFAMFLDYLPKAQDILDSSAFVDATSLTLLMPFVNVGENWAEMKFETLPLETRWAMARQMNSAMQALQASMQAGKKSEDLERRLDESLEREEKTEMRLWWVLGLALALAVISAISIRQQLQVRRLRKKFALSKAPQPQLKGSDKAIDSIREAITSGRNIQTALVHLSAINLAMNGEQKNWTVRGARLPILEGLTDSELTLLEHILDGHSAKESSVLLGVSSGHVYNVRSILRDKLGLPKERDIRDWLIEELEKVS